MPPQSNDLKSHLRKVFNYSLHITVLIFIFLTSLFKITDRNRNEDLSKEAWVTSQSLYLWRSLSPCTVMNAYKASKNYFLYCLLNVYKF